MTATTATATELGIRLSGERFYAARAEGRYRVIDGDLIDARQDGDAPGTAYVATCASRAKAEEKAAALNAELAAEDALTAAINRGDEAGADNARAELAATYEAQGETPADAAALAAADTGAAIVAAVSPAAAKGVTRTEDGAVVLASGLVEGSAEANAAEAAESARFEAAHAAKPEADTKAYRIGKVLREYVLGADATAAPSLVAHIASRNVCYDGTATLRLSFADAAVLAQMAADLEKTATAPWATMAARSAQKTLRNLFVGATV
jgi:hypothetical protein